MLSKKFGPSRTLPTMMLCFGFSTLMIVAVKNFGGLLACRWFLGMVCSCLTTSFSGEPVADQSNRPKVASSQASSTIKHVSLACIVRSGQDRPDAATQSSIAVASSPAASPFSTPQATSRPHSAACSPSASFKSTPAASPTGAICSSSKAHAA